MTSFDPAETRAMRHAMVTSQLRTNAVRDPRVVTAMASIPRERFLPPTARAVAYRDTAIPLGGGRHLNPPLATARLLTEAELLAEDRVLLVGAAGGYAAAVLAGLVAHVTALESDAGDGKDVATTGLLAFWCAQALWQPSTLWRTIQGRPSSTATSRTTWIGGS